MPDHRILTTQDGSHTLHFAQLGVNYHSKFGAIQETQHVFINAALRVKAVRQKQIDILEIGFGTGLNAYMTILEAVKRNLKVHYEAIEAFPLDDHTVSLFNYPTLLEPEVREDHFLLLHQAEWEKPSVINENFDLLKRKTTFQEITYSSAFDIIYFDAFAPDAQPELWEASLFSKMYDALKPDGILVTYCAKGVVKRTMKAVGFEVESLKGPPGKREMTRAIKVL